LIEPCVNAFLGYYWGKPLLLVLGKPRTWKSGIVTLPERLKYCGVLFIFVMYQVHLETAVRVKWDCGQLLCWSDQWLGHQNLGLDISHIPHLSQLAAVYLLLQFTSLGIACCRHWWI